MDPDTELKAREIVLAASARRSRLPRGVWIVAIVLGVVCASAVAIAWWQERDTVSNHPLAHVPEQSSGLGVGLIIGLVVGIALGVTIALRKR